MFHVKKKKNCQDVLYYCKYIFKAKVLNDEIFIGFQRVFPSCVNGMGFLDCFINFIEAICDTVIEGVLHLFNISRDLPLFSFKTTKHLCMFIFSVKWDNLVPNLLTVVLPVLCFLLSASLCSPV